MKHACLGLLSTNTFWPQRHVLVSLLSGTLLLCSFSCCCTVSFGCFGPYLWQERAPLDRDKTFVIYFYWLWCGPHRCPRRGQLTGRQWIRLALHTHTRTNTHTHSKRDCYTRTILATNCGYWTWSNSATQSQSSNLSTALAAAAAFHTVSNFGHFASDQKTKKSNLSELVLEGRGRGRSGLAVTSKKGQKWKVS